MVAAFALFGTLWAADALITTHIGHTVGKGTNVYTTFHTPNRSRLILIVAVAIVSVLASVLDGTFRSPATVKAVSLQPNVVLVLTDDQTKESVTASPMPYLSSRPYGNWFEGANFFTSTPLCCPNRATLFTGQYSHNHGVLDNTFGDVMDDTSTLATWLDSGGYNTSLIGKYLNAYPWKKGPTYIPPGWDNWEVFANPPKPDFYNYRLNENGILKSYGSTAAEYSTDVITNKGVAFINGAATTGEPFYLQLSYHGPHRPIIPAPRHATLGVKTPAFAPNFNEADVSDKPAWIQSQPLITATGTVKKRRADEYRALRAIDEGIEDVFAALSAQGILENTVFVFMTDNGVSMGEHRWNHKTCVYEECIKSPLMVRYPGATPQVSRKLISSVDFASTIADIAGVTPTRPQDGTSFKQLVNNPSLAWRDSLLVEWRGGEADAGESTSPKYWAVRTENWKYNELDTGEKELYDMVNDPYELVNQAGNPLYATTQAAMAAELLELKP